ncbi:MAG: DUF4105 domain-containing protein [Proteobacteria bacterium]|nr:DUF4105 domain-containing protein [Pseudomonadota bacterium]
MPPTAFPPAPPRPFVRPAGAGSAALGVVLSALAAAPRPARAATVTPPVVEVLAIAPGPQLYAHWGHNALRIRLEPGPRGEADYDRVFDWGHFRYGRAFLWRYVTAQPYYRLKTEPFADVLERYRRRQRWIAAQAITMSREQALGLVRRIDAALALREGEFPYDSLINNCTTKLRDLLDSELFAGALQQAMGPARDGRTFREISDLHLRHVPLTRWAVNLVYSAFADRPLSRWDAAFLPIALFDLLEDARGAGATLGLPAGVTIERGAVRGEVPFDRTPPPLDRGWRWIALALASWVAFLLLPALRPRGRATLLLARLGLALWTMSAGTCGTLLVLFALSPSPNYAHNLNLIAFHPLLFALPLLARRASRGARLPRLGLLLLAALPLLGLGAAALTGQRVWPYLLPALLVQGAIALRAERLARDRHGELRDRGPAVPAKSATGPQQ